MSSTKSSPHVYTGKTYVIYSISTDDQVNESNRDLVIRMGVKAPDHGRILVCGWKAMKPQEFYYGTLYTNIISSTS